MFQGSMSEEPGESLAAAAENSVVEKMPENHSSSSSDSDDGKSSFSSKIHRLFGRQKTLHNLLGGGKPADVFLWRNKRISGIALALATVIWILFECMEYHLLTLICHIFILYLVIMFLWSGGSTFFHRSPPPIPEIKFSEETFLQAASAIRVEANRFFAALHDVASGKDLKTFLLAIASLWILSIVGSCCNFLTLFYSVFVAALTLPVFYEKYEDEVDAIAHRASVEIKKLYRSFDANVWSKIPRIPRGPAKQKKCK